MDGKVEVIWRTLCTISNSLMVHARFLEAYIYFSLIYTTYHVSLVLPIKYLINEEGKRTTPFKLATGTKPSVQYLRVLFHPCVIQKATTHAGTKALNMCHQAHTHFRGIFLGIPQHQKQYLVYIPSTRKIISSYDVLFNEMFPSALGYTSQPNA